MGNIRDYMNGDRSESGEATLKFLKDNKTDGWKKGGELLFYLHPDGIHTVWRATFPTTRISTRPESEGERYVSFRRYVSPDPEKVHCAYRRWKDGQWKYRHADGSPKFPPVCDPFLRVTSYLYSAVKSGKVDSHASVFSWQLKDERRVFHAGGISGIVEPESFKDSQLIQPKLESALLVIDHNDPTAGIQIGHFTSMLVGRVDRTSPRINTDEGLIHKILQELRDDEIKYGGDPESVYCTAETPWPFLLKYNASAKNAADYYTLSSKRGLVREGRLKVPDAVRELLAAPAPDADQYLRPRDDDAETLYEAMRSANDGCDVRLPLDEIFDPWFKALGGGDSAASTSAVVPDAPVGGSALESCGGDLGGDECGLRVSPEWSECPRCGTAMTGSQQPPSMDDLRAANHPRMCRVCRADAGLADETCPACKSDPDSDTDPFAIG